MQLFHKLCKINLILLVLINSFCALKAEDYKLTPALNYQINAAVQRTMAQKQIPGLALAIVIDGHPFFIKGYGVANLTTGEPVTLQTRFALASLSKVLTTFAVLHLVQEGKINLDTSIRQYLPGAPSEWQAVTVRHLLSHTSGISQYQGPHFPWVRTWRLIAERPLDFTPGTAVKYNNFGYLVLGRLIEVVSKQSYVNFMQTQIFNPLEMYQTNIPSTLFPQGLAEGYEAVDGQLYSHSNQRPWSRMGASRGIVSTITDMARWEAAMSRGAILAPWNYELMWEPTLLANGEPCRRSLGWHVSQDNGKTVIDKNGSISGYSAWIERHLEDKISVIILCNLTASRSLHRLAQTLIDSIKTENKRD